MPIYEYACPKCGEFEVTQRITEDPLKKCPTCRSKVRKLISNTSFHLKGSGWYATDYAKKGSGAPKSDSSANSSNDSSSKSSDGESKAKDTSSETKSSPDSSKPKAKDTASKAA
jgi:putative FmdB family regulatory protein